ncbi:hypothetical protein FACS1894179_02970 [Bacteroidia bacterium]|nr:hypothetical protein FACS1894179_02970 [Bacteroidia bacterium]
MFIDYYKILGIPENSTSTEIKEAFRKEIKKYHDDTNMGNGNVERTRQIIEAKYILLDDEARRKYDIEYQKYKSYVNSEEQASVSNYEMQDDILEKWMQNARQQAKDMYKEIVDEFKESAKASYSGIISFLKYILPFIIGYFLFKMCTGR